MDFHRGGGSPKSVRHNYADKTWEMPVFSKNVKVSMSASRRTRMEDNKTQIL